ncbi:peptidase U32, partial [Candidatus Falkowbacteria bacterium CG10_big_fil_rev_8_21_14_0_10_37_6]
GNKIANQGKYYMSAKDLCMIEYIPELIKAGIDSFKIEGRRRDPRYIGTVSRCYREAVDSYFAGTYTKEKILTWKKDLEGVYNRGFETGFFFGTPGPEGVTYDKSDNVSKIKKTRIGIVTKFYSQLNVALIKLTEKGLKLEEDIYIEGNKTYLKQKITSMEIEGKKIKQAKKGEEVGIKVDKKTRAGDNVFIIV